MKMEDWIQEAGNICFIITAFLFFNEKIYLWIVCSYFAVNARKVIKKVTQIVIQASTDQQKCNRLYFEELFHLPPVLLLFILIFCGFIAFTSTKSFFGCFLLMVAFTFCQLTVQALTSAIIMVFVGAIIFKCSVSIDVLILFFMFWLSLSHESSLYWSHLGRTFKTFALRIPSSFKCVIYVTLLVATYSSSYIWVCIISIIVDVYYILSRPLVLCSTQCEICEAKSRLEGNLKKKNKSKNETLSISVLEVDLTIRLSATLKRATLNNGDSILAETALDDIISARNLGQFSPASLIDNFGFSDLIIVAIQTCRYMNFQAFSKALKLMREIVFYGTTKTILAPCMDMLCKAGVFVVVEMGLRLPVNLYSDVRLATHMSIDVINDHIYEYLLSTDDRKLITQNSLELIILFYENNTEDTVKKLLSTHNSMIAAILVNVLSRGGYNKLDCKAIDLLNLVTPHCKENIRTVTDSGICKISMELFCVDQPSNARNICILILKQVNWNKDYEQQYKSAGAVEAVMNLLCRLRFNVDSHREIAHSLLKVLNRFSCDYDSILLLGELGLIKVILKIRDIGTEDSVLDLGNILLYKLFYSVKYRNEFRALRSIQYIL